jgi:hypothetical protein
MFIAALYTGHMGTGAEQTLFEKCFVGELKALHIGVEVEVNGTLYFTKVRSIAFMTLYDFLTPYLMPPFPNRSILTGEEEEAIGSEARDILEISGLLVSLRTPKSLARRQYHNFLQACWNGLPAYIDKEDPGRTVWPKDFDLGSLYALFSKSIIKYLFDDNDALSDLIDGAPAHIKFMTSKGTNSIKLPCNNLTCIFNFTSAEIFNDVRTKFNEKRKGVKRSTKKTRPDLPDDHVQKREHHGNNSTSDR